MIQQHILKTQFEKLVAYNREKIEIAESIKVLKESLKDEGLEKGEIAALVKVAAAKAKEDVESLNAQADKLLEIIELVN